ncbi:P-type conjugative transfer protein TrbJ [Rhodoligotrophos defluvii]|uniref:P-type conjugative transfer protein TrbJ n=1 Tax=Rhodoligotrophos defluvii TaxID=2561934 RepID=UPI0010CA125F|nr:P-type conjugative transfer protein TrbJ [Rhodoligotrophos defluvii]
MKRQLGAACLAVCFAFLPIQPARALFGAGDVVFDPSNYSQNVLQAARALQQITNQIRSLQNEVLMLQNMAKHLERLDYSSLHAIEMALRRVNLLMARAEGIAFEIDRTEQEFARLYPKDYAATVTTDELSRDARARWEHSMDALRQTMLVQAQVVQNVNADTGELARLVTASEAAIGSLQAQQATNQLVALSTKQQLQAQELVAAQYRAEALERARATAAQEQARAQFSRFLGDGQAYTPRH